MGRRHRSIILGGKTFIRCRPETAQQQVDIYPERRKDFAFLLDQMTLTLDPLWRFPHDMRIGADGAPTLGFTVGPDRQTTIELDRDLTVRHVKLAGRSGTELEAWHVGSISTNSYIFPRVIVSSWPHDRYVAVEVIYFITVSVNEPIDKADLEPPKVYPWATVVDHRNTPRNCAAIDAGSDRDGQGYAKPEHESYWEPR
jgi:hypothetical protein